MEIHTVFLFFRQRSVFDVKSDSPGNSSQEEFDRLMFDMITSQMGKMKILSIKIEFLFV